MWNRSEYTICAVSTPQGTGGISVIRVSGKEALSFCKKIVKSKALHENPQSHRAYYGSVEDENSNKIDDVLVTYFGQGKSFTGEETVEISCHGSPYISAKILEALVFYGAKIAERGEFTFRAFMNGKLDLVQAESVLSLIESRSSSSNKVALRQLEGHTSKEYESIVSDLTWCLAHIEAAIDFAEQGIEVVDPNILLKRVQSLSSRLLLLIQSYRSGRLIKDGVTVALVGEPNVGKSSLLNLLVKSERAIVTPIAGTTRDVVEGEAVFEGMNFKFNDTAGVRETMDAVEAIGISRSKNAATKSDVLCIVFDCSAHDWTGTLALSEQIQHERKLFILNKADVGVESVTQIKNLLPPGAVSIATSALDPSQRDLILALIKASLGTMDGFEGAVVSSARQFEQAQYSYEMISKSIQELENKTGPEFVAMYLKEALISLQKILGQVYDDQIMDRVFKEFCLGK